MTVNTEDSRYQRPVEISLTSPQPFFGSHILSALAVFFAGLLVPAGLVITWLNHDRMPVYWDRRSYMTLARAVSASFQDSYAQGVHMLMRLTSEDYNGYFVTLLLPFLHGKRTSNHAYVGALLLVGTPLFLLASLALGRVVSRGGPFWSWRYIWPLLAVTPIAWTVTLGGLPDLIPGAALVGAVILLAYNLERIRITRLVLGGLLLGLAIALRRHFAYPALAALFAFALLRLWCALHQPCTWFRRLSMAGWPAAIAGLSTLVLVATLVPGFIEKGISQEHVTAYASYVHSTGYVLAYSLQVGGGLLLLIGIAGWWLMLSDSSANRPALAFIAIWLLSWLALWALHVGYTNVHYYFCMWTVFLSVAYWGITLRLNHASRRNQISVLLTLYGILCVLAAHTLLPKQFLRNGMAHVPAMLIPASYGPTPTDNLDNYRRMASCIEQMDPSRKLEVMVAASSDELNRDIMATMNELRGQAVDRVDYFPTPEVDSRDGSPLSALLRGDVVIAAWPFQRHLAPGQQKTVEVPNAALVGSNGELKPDYDMTCKVPLVGADYMAAFKRRNLLDGALVAKYIRISSQTRLPLAPWELMQDGFEWASVRHKDGNYLLSGNIGVSTKPTRFLEINPYSASQLIDFKATFQLADVACKRAIVTPLYFPMSGGDAVPLKATDIADISPHTIVVRHEPKSSGYLVLQVDSGSSDRNSIAACGFHMTVPPR